LERLVADLLADEFHESLEIDVDVESLPATREDVELDILPGLQERFGVYGAVLRSEEELGHVSLHSGVLEAVRSVDDVLRLMGQDAYHKMDRNARRFAAAVLMAPEPLCKEAARLYPALIDEAGFHSERVLGAMARSLSRDFRVPETAMRFRMMT